MLQTCNQKLHQLSPVCSIWVSFTTVDNVRKFEGQYCIVSFDCCNVSGYDYTVNKYRYIVWLFTAQNRHPLRLKSRPLQLDRRRCRCLGRLAVDAHYSKPFLLIEFMCLLYFFMFPQVTMQLCHWCERRRFYISEFCFHIWYNYLHTMIALRFNAFCFDRVRVFFLVYNWWRLLVTVDSR